MPHQTFFKSELETRTDAKVAKVRQTESDRRAVYRAVEQRDGMRCRACAQKVAKFVGLFPNRLEHHHIRGRGAKDSETTKNICLLCRLCHEARHTKRTLHIAGNADGSLRFEREGRKWNG